MQIHTEKTFEDAIEANLLGSGGWKQGDPHDFNAELALLPKDLFAFIRDTQPDLWRTLATQQKKDLEPGFLEALTKHLEMKGTLDVLRHGFKFFGKKIDVATFRPAHGLNPDILTRYGMNRLTVSRQVKFAVGEEKSIDMLLSLNGLPVATAELKNPLTGQTVENALTQYRKRDPKHRLFQFEKRALVHFAVDPDQVYMTTRLTGKDTIFLPFNRGNHGGAGNPENPGGYRTAYLWEEIWQRDSFLDILGRFAHVFTEEKQVAQKVVTREVVIFPRYHQLDSVRKLEGTARSDGPGHSYLVQHSAGSGKSNSIAWLAHRLSTLHTENDQKVFDSVVVITDRRVLDRQLQDTIYQFEHKVGVVARIDEDSTQLAEELAAGTPIIITTLQKFPFVTEKIGQLPKRSYAVIVDEAHSSQSGEGARQLKEVLGAKTLEEAEKEEAETAEETSEDRLLKVMASRGPQKNLSFFAFTATPKAKTLEVFGHKGLDGKPAPFHLYSMRQAIEEGFIFDVLRGYTTYRTFYRLAKAIEDDPKVSKKQATRQLARFMSLHPHNIAQKTELMVEHFRTSVKHRIGGRAKAMVVTSSRLHAVRYMQAFQKYLAEKGYKDIGVLVAFSGTVQDPDVAMLSYTEVGMNKGIREGQLPGRFATDEFQILLAANKFQTGFDQPLLHTMYVDKRLSGVQAVQTLSRLNRVAPGKEDTFVLDFVNEADEIQRSFQPYYEQTIVAETADPNRLYELQHELESAQVFSPQEVEGLCGVFYAPKERQTVGDQARMYGYLNPGVDRFLALDEERQEEFRSALKGYIGLYSFLSEIMPFSDRDLEQLFTFARFLLLKLPRDPKKDPLDLQGEVALKYYRLDKTSEGRIDLDEVHEPVPIYGPIEVGSRKGRDDVTPLSEIIDILNERFGTNFTKVDQLFFDQVTEKAKTDEEVKLKAGANTFDNFALSVKDKILDVMIERMDDNTDIVARFMNDPEFQRIAFRERARKIYEEARTR
ncbi:MAG TPA: type I restriction endonuclease [Thermoanaerobaculia bacterium]|nr:type I restriction endonuclease [Thermoanaerobaculia bacterium]